MRLFAATVLSWSPHYYLHRIIGSRVTSASHSLGFSLPLSLLRLFNPPPPPFSPFVNPRLHNIYFFFIPFRLVNLFILYCSISFFHSLFLFYLPFFYIFHLYLIIWFINLFQVPFSFLSFPLSKSICFLFVLSLFTLCFFFCLRSSLSSSILSHSLHIRTFVFFSPFICVSTVSFLPVFLFVSLFVLLCSF